MEPWVKIALVTLDETLEEIKLLERDPAEWGRRYAQPCPGQGYLNVMRIQRERIIYELGWYYLRLPRDYSRLNPDGTRPA